MFLREQAEDFLGAFKVLQENHAIFIDKLSQPPTSTSSEGAIGTGPTMGPAIVCLAFSVELHIKYLHHSIFRKSPRGHNILNLFKSLPEDIQKKVFTHQSISDYGWNFSEFETQISKISDGFEKWRYAHESVSVHYNAYFALVFIEAMRLVANSNLIKEATRK